MPHTQQSGFAVLGLPDDSCNDPGFGELKPSTYELPVLRVRFRDPEGNPQHATYSTTWRELDGVLLTMVSQTQAPPHPLADQLRQVLANAVGAMLGPLGCELIGVDVVASEFEVMAE